MLTWGYGKLDHAPAGELLDQIAHRLEMDVSLYHHQAVSNMFYSLARLQKYNPSMCSAVETHVTTHIEDFSPQVRHLVTAEFLRADHSPIIPCFPLASAFLSGFLCAAGIDEHSVGLCEVPLCTRAIH